MKKHLIYLFLFLPASLFAQVVNEVVTFDNYVSASDNDFQNKFDTGSGGMTLNQIQTNGITGGCLETPAFVNWYWDNAVYCTRMKASIGSAYNTSVCFKYDTTDIYNINFDKPVAIWWRPGVDPDHHYIIARVTDSDSREVEIACPTAFNTSTTVQLQQNHWYILVLSANFSGGATNDEIALNAQLSDLGLTGMDPPVTVGFTDVLLHDSIIIADTAIEVSVTGTYWGGARYLDNFQITGIKSFDNCVSIGLPEINNGNAFSWGLENNTLSVTVKTDFQGGELEIYNLSGQCILTRKVSSEIIMMDVALLTEGIYFISLESEGKHAIQKFPLVRK